MIIVRHTLHRVASLVCFTLFGHARRVQHLERMTVDEGGLQSSRSLAMLLFASAPACGFVAPGTAASTSRGLLDNSLGSRVSNLRLLADDAEIDALRQIRWLPAVDTSSPDSEPSSESALTMPLFLLPSPWMPGTADHTLTIFEPRYRKLYDNILYSGTRKFVIVRPHSEEQGRLAEVGIVVYLDDLKDINEETGDKLKYICKHTVKSRVRLKKVLNPKDWQTEENLRPETYLRAEVEEFNNDEDVTGGLPQRLELENIFLGLIEQQEKSKENPRFGKEILDQIEFESVDGLWRFISLWQQFLKMKLGATSKGLQQDVQKLVLEWVEKEKIEEVRPEMMMSELPAELQQAIRSIQKRYQEDVEVGELDPNGLLFQAFLQTHSHADRLNLMSSIIDQDCKRLAARAALGSLFG